VDWVGNEVVISVGQFPVLKMILFYFILSLIYLFIYLFTYLCTDLFTTFGLEKVSPLF